MIKTYRGDGHSGFTLIELLIVIVILAILVVVLISTINPVEQIRKANDAAKKSDSSEVLSAMERYYTTFAFYPCEVGAPACAGGTAADTTPTALTSAGKLNLITELVTKNEVKPELANRPSLASLFISKDAGTNLLHVCYLPESQTYTAQAKVSGYCPSGAPVTGCICIPEQ